MFKKEFRETSQNFNSIRQRIASKLALLCCYQSNPLKVFGKEEQSAGIVD
jgi:hypothetical protein